MTFLADAFPGAGSEALAAIEKMTRRTTYGAGQTLYSADQDARIGVLVSGLLRTVVSLRDGRRAALHYTRPGAVFGLPTLFSDMPLAVEVVRRSEVIDLDPKTVERVANDLPHFGWLISRQLAGEVNRVPGIIEEFGFKSVRGRLARHLVELSIPTGSDGPLVVHETQEALANSVGSVREVVSRCLRSLKEEGLIRVAPKAITLIDPNGLRQLSE